MKPNEELFIVTDGCMWEQNKQNSTYYPHAIEVVNERTGQVRYIRSGSRITFVEGEISEGRDQETYNKATSQMCSAGEDELQRGRHKKGSRANVKEKRHKAKRV